MKRSRLLLPRALVFATLLSFAPAAAQTTKDKAPAATKTSVLDIHSSLQADLMTLRGIGHAYSKLIIEGRPYEQKGS